MPVSVTLRLTRVGFCRKRAWFADRSSWSLPIRFPALIALIEHPVLGVLLFDSGYGRALEQSASRAIKMYRRVLPFELPERERIGARLAQLDCPAINRIFLSHFHPDHIGGLREIAVATTPIVCSRDGLARLRSLRGIALARSAFFPELLPEDFDRRAQAIEDLPAVAGVGPFPEGRDLAGDGSLVAIPLPGHAAGQYGLLCRTTGGRVFLCADAAWLRTNIVDRALPPWPVRLLVDDYHAFVQTLERLHELSRLHPEVRIIPSHCEPSISAYGQLD